MNNIIPIVSIICPTYNHEKFITQALDGFLMQKTLYPFEIIVHDDASTDNTAEIVKEYELKHPGYFRNIYQTENQLSKSIDNVSRITYNASRGKYIAVCEGDDCWMDSQKLQKQIEFLELNPEYVGCFHNAEERFDEDNRASFLYCTYPSARNIKFEDLSYGNPIPTCSLMYRKGLLKEFPNWFYKLKMCDWPLHLINAQFGDFWYMPKIMSFHRIHVNSLWTLQGDDRNKRFLLEAYEVMIDEFKHNKNFQNQLIIAKQTFINDNKSSKNIFRKTLNFLKKAT
jgi:glycosyltransferase involved in cell wall biosynthesis